MSEDEITAELQSQGVTHVRRFTRKDDVNNLDMVQNVAVTLQFAPAAVGNMTGYSGDNKSYIGDRKSYTADSVSNLGLNISFVGDSSKVLQNRPEGHATQREHVEAGDVNLYSGLQDRENDKQTYTYLKTYENAGVAASTGTDSTNEYEGLERKDQQHYEAIKLAMYGNTGKDATYMNT
ncbi:uncharacterized protein [Haliotis asinina]|uniref:uncharacterized protein n=1 Tax=Haliotis asinina TaxID=109174 RepID=UPI003531F438